MTSTFDNTGITLDRYADIRARLVALAEAEWGEGINTDEDELLGHLFSSLSTLLAEINEIAQELYDSDGINSTGAHLDNSVELIGLDRSAAAYSTVTLTLTATVATTVEIGSQYSTAAGVVFATDEALVFSGAGTDTVAATCTVTGPNEAAATEVNTIVTSVYGISTVNNVADAIPGRDRQTSAELKEDHTIAVATSGEQDTASIYEALVGVTGVRAAYVFENDTSATIGVVPARTIHCSVIGGSDADVAASIDNTKTSAVPTYGGESVSVYNATTRQAKDINFDRAIATDTHIEVTRSTVSGIYPDDGDDQIKAALVAHFADITIDEDVVFNALYAPLYTVVGMTVTALKLDTVDPPTGTSDLLSTALIRYTLDEDDIDIVTP